MRSCLSPLGILLSCFIGLTSQSTHAEVVVLQDDRVRAVFDRQTAALRGLKSDQSLLPISASGCRVFVQDFPGGATHALVAESCHVFDQRVKCKYTGAEMTCELDWRIDNGMLRTDGRLENRNGRDRAVVLTYELSLAEDGLRFSPSLNGFTPVTDQPQSSSVYPL